MLRRNNALRLAARSRILYLWNPAVPPGTQADSPMVPKAIRPSARSQVRTGSLPEMARRRGPKPGWAFQEQAVLRQVGPTELPVPNADEGRRAFSWLLFSEPTF